MTPYASGAGWELWHGDCRGILPSFDPVSIDLLLTDPPYRIRERRRRSAERRPGAAGGYEHCQMQGEDDFDPSHLLHFKRIALFGANYFCHQLPPASGWIIWDKRAGITGKRGEWFCDNGEAEVIWTNIRMPMRVISHLWMGMLKGSEQQERRVHPTQKPVALMATLAERLTKMGDAILDPYAGSGSTLLGAVSSGRRAIGIEQSEEYCEIAARRLSATLAS